MKLIYIILLLSYLHACASEDVEYYPKEYTIVFYYVNPCWHIEKPSDPYNSNVDYRHFMKTECERVYANNWLKAKDNVINCAPTRNSRSVASVASSIAREVFTAGTNFLVNKLVESKMPRNQMMDMITYGTNYDNVFDANMPEFMSLSSEVSSRHIPETSRHGQDYPRGLMMSTALASEILANSANLDIISHWCRLGKLATYELGELVGDEKLQKIEPKRTKIMSVVRGDHDESIIFHFIVHQEHKTLSPIQASLNQTASKTGEQAFERSHFWYYLSFGIVLSLANLGALIYPGFKHYRNRHNHHVVHEEVSMSVVVNN